MPKYLMPLLFMSLCVNQLTQPLKAQILAATDYIVLNDGDTLRGKVTYINERSFTRQFHNKLRITTENGKKKRINRKNISSFKIGKTIYKSFWLDETIKGLNIFNPRYYIDTDEGNHHFLKVIRHGKVNQYALEWFEQGDSFLNSISLLRKNHQNYFIRADQGVFGLKKKILSNYFNDCPKLITKINNKELDKVFQVVEFYNNNCKN